MSYPYLLLSLWFGSGSVKTIERAFFQRPELYEPPALPEGNGYGCSFVTCSLAFAWRLFFRWSRKCITVITRWSRIGMRNFSFAMKQKADFPRPLCSEDMVIHRHSFKNINNIHIYRRRLILAKYKLSHSVPLASRGSSPNCITFIQEGSEFRGRELFTRKLKRSCEPAFLKRKK